MNPFASANKVFVAYCSSDAWLGDVSAAQTLAANGFDWSFRGRRIIRATLDLLASDLGLGAASPTGAAQHRLLFGGCSAGGRGAMFNLDRVAALAPAGVTVSGLLDSPLWINVAPFDPSIPSFELQCADALRLFNASAVLSPPCVASQAAGQEYLCLMGEYLMPSITTPYALSASQFDAFQLPYDVGAMPSVGNSAQVAYANAWQRTTLGVLSGLPTPAQASSSAVFSLSCLHHCVTLGPAFWEMRVGNTTAGVSFAQLAGQWFYQGVCAKEVGLCIGYQRCVMC